MFLQFGSGGRHAYWCPSANLHWHKIRPQGFPSLFLRKKPWGRGWMGTSWKKMVTVFLSLTRRREPQLERRVGSDHQIQAPVRRHDAAYETRHAPPRLVFFVLFSLYLTVNFGSCLMIASQEA